MEKEKLSEELRGLVGENSLSQRTWDDYLENSVMPNFPSEEEKKGDFLQKHANVLKSFNGQLNNEVATRVNDFKKNYKPEPQHQASDPQPQTGSDKKLDDLESRVKKFEQAEAEKQEKDARTKLLLDVKSQIMKDGATNQTIIGLVLSQLDIKSDSKLDDLSKSAKGLYDKTYSDLYGESYVPAHGGGSYGGGNKRSEQDAYLKHLKETGRIPNTN